MCRSLLLHGQECRAVLSLSLCNGTRRDPSRVKFSYVCHSERSRGISNCCFESRRGEKRIAIPQQRETPFDMTNVTPHAVSPVRSRFRARVRSVSSDRKSVV